MIHREGNGDQQKITIECDTSGCDSIFEGEPGENFASVWGGAKRDGWTSRRVGEEWLHGCKTCGRPT